MSLRFFPFSDDSGFTIEGHTELLVTDDVAKTPAFFFVVGGGVRGGFVSLWFFPFSDDNGFTFEGHTELLVTEDVAKRHETRNRRGFTVQYGNRDVDASLQQGIFRESSALPSRGHLS